MKKILASLAAALLLVLSLATAVGAQEDPVVGTVTSDPPTVPTAGEHTLTATGTGFVPDSTLLLGSCTSPADTLVAGVSTPDDITAAAVAISPLEHCDVANALQVTTDSDGSFEQEVTATIGDNFFLTAGTLPGQPDPQQGAVWVPIVADEAATGAAADEADLAVTGVESGMLAGVGVALLLIGASAVELGRRRED